MKHIKYIFYFFILVGFIYLNGCRPEEEFTTDPSIQLKFSADTILFDTVFTQLTSGERRPISVTKQLRVTNPSSNAIRVNIRLAGMAGNTYRLNVDGVPSNQVYGKEVMGKDSLIIFIQCYIDTTTNSGRDSAFIKEDEIVFETNGNQQQVKLVAWGQNAKYFNNQVLDCNSGNLVWTATKPYVIYDSILVPKGCTLTIEAGTKIHSFNKSCLLVAGTLIVNGTAENPVVFEGTRLDQEYKDLPNQWIGIRFLAGSKDNRITHAIIRNGFVGIEVDSQPVNTNPNLRITNTQIYNMAAVGIVGYSAHVEAINNEISNCGQFGFFGALGGNYILHHNTLAGITSGFSRQNPFVVFDNSPYTDANNQIIARYNLSFNVVNNIIYGNLDDEFLLNNNPLGIAPTNLVLQTNLIKTEQPGLDANGNIINKDPLFENTALINYKLKENSPAKGKGTNLGITTDIKGNIRAATPSIGCWE